MVFKKMLGAFGVGGPSVDTVLSNPNTRPGLTQTGHVILTGGNHDIDIEHISLGLVTRIEIEGGDSEHGAIGEFHRAGVTNSLRLAAGQQLSIPFQITMPWETPITAVYSEPLHGMTMGVRTEVAIARAVDKGDIDPVYVHPLPVQQKILEAFAGLGFQFENADLEYGHIAGVHQTLPFYQEIEFFPAVQYAGLVNEVELTFITNSETMDVVLEFDKRGGLFTGGHDNYGRYTVAHADADHVDWAERVDTWVRQALDHHRSLLATHHHPYSQPAGYPAPGYPAAAYPGVPGHPSPYGVAKDGGHYQHHERRGSGMDGVIAGAALGVAGGLVAGEILDEVFDDDGGDEFEE